MLILIFFAFFGGIVTILSPCILPVLPIVLSGSVTGGKGRPWGVITGFIVSFTFFTLFLATLVQATGVSADTMRTVSVFIIFAFGMALVIPKFRKFTEQAFSKLASGILPKKRDASSEHVPDFIAGLLIGISLGLVWTPCVGPILASVITLAAASTVTAGSAIITISYAVFCLNKNP